MAEAAACAVEGDAGHDQVDPTGGGADASTIAIGGSGMPHELHGTVRSCSRLSTCTIRMSSRPEPVIFGTKTRLPRANAASSKLWVWHSAGIERYTLTHALRSNASSASSRSHALSDAVLIAAASSPLSSAFIALRIVFFATEVGRHRKVAERCAARG